MALPAPFPAGSGSNRAYGPFGRFFADVNERVCCIMIKPIHSTQTKQIVSSSSGKPADIITVQASVTINGKRVNYYVTKPANPENIKGVVIGSHGLKSNAKAQFLTETSPNHGGLAEKFAAAGYVVYFADLPSFGQSEGTTDKRFNIKADEATDTLVKMADIARQQNPKMPLALYGHSFGGTVVLSKAVRLGVKPDAIMAEAPAVAPHGVAEAIGLPSATVAQKLGFGAKPVPLLGDFSADTFSDLPQVRQQMRDDPSVTFGVLADNVTFNTSSTINTLMGEFEHVETAQWDQKTPVLVAHSTQDKVTNPDASRQLVEHLKASDVPASFNSSNVAAHNPANSSIGEEFAAQTIDWLDQVIANKTK